MPSLWVFSFVPASVKQVVSFNGEKRAIALYNKLIHKSYKAALEEGVTHGLGLGSSFCIFFSGFGLSIWYGGKLILSKGYSGGDIINILFAIMTGAMWVSLNLERKNDVLC
jgi:ATP-binding cassette subfamily B (MDR/TAP) protein 1